MTKPFLVGMVGLARSGKDTVGEMLGSYGFQRFALADSLKAIATEIGWDGSKEGPSSCKCCGMLQGRALLQVLGTEGVRKHLGPDVWIDALDREILAIEDASFGGSYVVTDIRYKNEAHWIWRRGGQVWRVVRSEVEVGDPHASEVEQAEIPEDVTLLNDGTLDDLRKQVFQQVGFF